MCGVAGSWSRIGSLRDADRLRAGLNAIRHRGPDDLGEFFWTDPSSSARVDLGLARLAILDLSPAGHQPMSTADGRFTLTFNGEITNYVEIRDELRTLGETFNSGGDSEVLLKSWARWGFHSIDHFEGMFAIAILDTVGKTLTLVRDRYGIKPLFYTHDEDRLAFCSELSGLLEISQHKPDLDWQTAVDYLQWGYYDFSERTFINGVKHLPPGHYVTLDTVTGKLLEPTRYWRPAILTAYKGKYSDAVDEVRSLLLDSVGRNLRSDVPLGIAVSGGLDSSSIVGAVRQLEPDLPINTFSFIAPGFAKSEHHWIDLVAKSTGSHSHTVATQSSDLAKDLDDLIISQGEPFGGTSIYAQYRVFKLARENGVVVTLDGQGADEIFGGYFGYPAQRLHSLIENGSWRSATKFAFARRDLPDWYRIVMPFEAMAQFAPPRLRHRVRRPLASPLLDVKKLRERDIDLDYPDIEVESMRGGRLKAHLRSTLEGIGLPMLLRHGDRNSMRFSIESRVPFLDRRLNELLFSLPEDWLVGPDGTTKRILRDAVRGWVPDEVIDRRDKIGFETPESDWQKGLAALPNDHEHPIGFLHNGRSDTLTGGLSEREIRWGRKSHWRLINLRRWVSLQDVNAG